MDGRAGNIAWRAESAGSALGASVLRQLGMEELVAQDRDRYVAIATGLAQHVAKLAALRSGLRERMAASVVMDHAKHARAVEEAFRMMNANDEWGSGAMRKQDILRS